MSQKFENLLNLSLETPEVIRKKTENLNVGYEGESNTWEVIIKYHGEIGYLQEYGIQVEELIAGYAILTVPREQMESLGEFEEIEYVEQPKKYYFETELPGENSCVYPVTLGEKELSGKGVIMAVLDSGIDYEREEFRREDGGTRILYLWDQTLVPTGEMMPPAGFRQGVEFDAKSINRALEGEKAPFLVVPSKDISGHGTAVAGIAAAGPVNRNEAGVYQGIAPECDLLIVKLGDVRERGFPKTTEIMRAVTYALRKGIGENRPIVINLSFGNSYGSHDGSSLLERFLDNAAEIGRTVICVGAGNEGDSAGHYGGHATDLQVVEIAVGEYENNLGIQVWKQYGDVFRIGLQAPNNTRITLPQVFGDKKQEYSIGNTVVLVYQGEPKPYSVLQETYFELIPNGRYIDPGVWKLEMMPVLSKTGRFDVYLPASEARGERTYFLRPTPELTLTVPSTSSKILTVGAYNVPFEQYAPFSGRGSSLGREGNSIAIAGLIKPDIVAPGVEILAPDVLGGYKSVTGTSFATPIVSGTAALLMEWGIIKGNDRYLYGEKIKAFLRKGAKPIRGEMVYPNEKVGFGKLCLADSIPER